MIGVGKHVSGKLVVIPYKASFEIVADSMQSCLSKILVKQETVEKMNTSIDAEHLSSSPPVMLLRTKRHYTVASLFSVIMFGSLIIKYISVPLSDSDTYFSQWAITIVSETFIITRSTPTHRGKGANMIGQAVVDVHSSLQ